MHTFDLNRSPLLAPGALPHLRSCLCFLVLCLTLQPSALRAASEACTLAQTPQWCSSTLFVALAAARDIGYAPGDSRRESISIENDFPDGPTKSEIVIEQHGIADDSVQASRYVIRLKAAADGQWQIAGTQRSWKCWPGRGSQTFSDKLCH